MTQLELGFRVWGLGFRVQAWSSIFGWGLVARTIQDKLKPPGSHLHDCFSSVCKEVEPSNIVFFFRNTIT